MNIFLINGLTNIYSDDKLAEFIKSAKSESALKFYPDRFMNIIKIIFITLDF